LLSPRGALAAIALAAVQTGCLAVQDIEEYQEPAMVNLPPMLNLSDVEPKGVRVCVDRRGDLLVPTEFKLSNIRDPNGPDGQTLAVRWFFDYSLASGSVNAQLKQDALKPLGKGTDVYEPTTMDTQTVLSLLTDSEPHALEAVVSDGFDKSDKEPRNRATLAGSFSVSYKWIVGRAVKECSQE